MSWDHRQFGTLADPIRQSALANIATQMGCAKRYSLERRDEGEPVTHAHWKPALGTAVHETLRRCFRPEPWAQISEMWARAATDRRAAIKAAPESLIGKVRAALRQELDRACLDRKTKQPRELRWYDDDPTEEIEAAVAMVLGALRSTSERAVEIVAAEVPFLVKVAGYYSSGTLDLIYRDADGALCLTDWKSGAHKMDEVTLHHGYQPSLYAEAMRDGVVWLRRSWDDEADAAHMRGRFAEIEAGAELAEDERRYGWPARIDVVHLRDFVPYKRAPAKKTGKTIEDQRGPAWYPSSRNPGDVVRLHVSLANVVGTVRLGRFVERIGEQCRRCRFRTPCLGEAPAIPSDQQRDMVAAMKAAGVEDDGLAEASE